MPSRDHLPLVVLLALTAVVAAVVQARTGFTDLEVYRFGGEVVLRGVPLYAADDPATGLPFTYPPFAAVLMAPVALLPAGLVAVLWATASVGALAALLHLVARAGGRPLTPALLVAATVVALLMEPVRHNLSFGQVNLFLALAVAVDLLRVDRRWAGVLVGVAAGIKLTPLVFVVLLVLAGRRTEAGRAVLAFAATVLLGLAVRPHDAAAYWTDVAWQPSRVGTVSISSNQSVHGLLARLVGGEPPTLLWLAVAGPVALGVVLVAAAWWRRGDRPLALVLGAVAMLLASPITWSHHWVWGAPAALVVLHRVGRWAAAAWAGVFLSAMIWGPPHHRGREHGWSLLEHVPGNGYVWAGLALAVWAGAQLRAGSTVPATSPSVIRSPDVPGAV